VRWASTDKRLFFHLRHRKNLVDKASGKVRGHKQCDKIFTYGRNGKGNGRATAIPAVYLMGGAEGNRPPNISGKFIPVSVSVAGPRTAMEGTKPG